MSRALLLVALLFAGPCFAAGFDLDAFYGKWLAAETSHLDGLSLLDDDVLIDNLEPLAGDCHAAQAEAPKDWRAAALLGLGYHFALCGAPEDDGIARNYLLRAWRHGPPEAGYFIAYYALDPSFFHDDPFLRHNEKRMCLRMQSVPDQLLTAAEKGFAPAQGVAGHLLLELREDNGKAQGWLKAAAEADCRPAQLWRAWWLYEGGLHEDALKQLQALDKLGDPAGAYALAFVHDPMFGKIEPDLKVARKQYQRALELGNYAAQWRLNDLPEIAQEDLKPEDIPAIYRRGWVEGNIERKQADLGNLAESYYACPPNRMLDWYPDIGNWLEQRIAPEVKAKDEADCYLYLAYAEMIAYRNWPAWDDDDLPIFPSDLVAKIDTDLCPEALIRAMEWTADRIQDDDFLQNLERAQLTKLPTAKRWYAMALLDGHLSKWLYFRNPDRYEQDDDMAVNILRTLAKEGDALSAIVLAEETRDAEVKFKWYEQAAKLGNPGAALFCARARMKGEGTQKDFAKAGTWLSVVAAYSADYAVTAASDMREMHRLSRRPGALEECAKLGKAAVESLNKQAGFDEFLQGNPRLATFAQRADDPALLALCYLKGHGVTQDIRRAQGLLGKQTGILDSYLTGWFHENAPLGGKPFGTGALICYESISDQPAAAYRLGMIHRAGDLTEQDDTKATEYFLRAANGGCIPAMLETAKAYHDGKGTEVDQKLAKKWAQKAADAGNEEAKKLLEDWK